MSRRALVLGAGGFIGSRVSRRLVGAGWTVTGVVRDPRAPSVQQRLAASGSEIRLVGGDATDGRLLRRLVADADAVFPFAGAAGIADSMRAPLYDARENAIGHLELLEAIRVANPKARVVFPGSRHQYGRIDDTPVDEDHPQRPTSVYGLHQRLAEGYYRLYHDVHGLYTTCLRITNAYGPYQGRRDGACGFVGTFIEAALRDGELRVYGSGNQKRDFLYIDDLAELCVRAVTDPRAVGEVFNAGGNQPTTARELAEAVVALVGKGRVVEADWPDLEAAIETGDYVSDITRARKTLGWEPTTSLLEGLTRTVEAGPSLR